MTALKGPVLRFAGFEEDVGDCICDGVLGREVPVAVALTLSTRLVIPPKRSVAWMEPWTCEPAISLYETRMGI